MKFDHLCKVNRTLDTIELYEEPIVLLLIFYVVLLRVVCHELLPKQKKRCKPWFNTACKDALKARKSALVRFKTNITTV